MDITVPPGRIALIPTNVVIEVPSGYVLAVTLRSSTPAKKGLLCPHGVGIIDRDYCGPEDEILVQAYNFFDEPVTITRGERIAQGLLLPVETCAWELGDPLPGASRGGFGSTG